MSTMFLVAAILSALWGVVVVIGIVHELRKRGVEVNFLLIRLYFFRYLGQYRKMTLEETGRVGPLYYSYLAAMLVALVCGVIGLVLRAM